MYSNQDFPYGYLNIKTMKNYSVKIMSALIMMISVLLTACNKEEKLNAEIEPAKVFDTSTPLGKKQKEFFDKFDVLFEYNWDRNVFARNAVADPANTKDILPYMEIMEELYFKALEKTAIKNSFVTKETPLTIYLIGSGINYGGAESFGESTVGQAGNIQPNRLTLGGLNNFGELLRKKNSDQQFLNMIYESATFSNPGDAGLIGFLYHEFTHYVNTRNDIPVPFALAAAANYLKGTDGYTRVSKTDAYKKGFLIPYGMQNEMEDFATYTQIMVWKTPEDIKKDYLLGPEAIRKYNYVDEYYKNLGLDLNKLRIYLQSPEVKASLLAIKKKYE
ncbi:substrate import-associated zinc metallohydrolase lipoprotein [Pedobacter steynii]|uniref:Substrate import-associated zinc metallohydrolase lipoprotein n=2 Tax=Pedobacter steynii TaxID=430522 RepID=A0A1G9UFS0_9SPHI|nr:substrate import-associated zinc metallohydrolase lipoprotein [Pedobacter steynii]